MSADQVLALNAQLEDLAELVARKIRQHAVQELPAGVLAALSDGAAQQRFYVSAGALSYGASRSGLRIGLELEPGRLRVRLEAFGSQTLAVVEFTEAKP